MLKKRLIGVITVKNGWAVQSFGYNRYLPLGKPERLAENLDRWGVDEILLSCIDRSANNSGPDFKTLERISQLRIATPLIYAGGIRSVEDGVSVVHLGADRISLDALLRDEMGVVEGLMHQLGSQALVASIPLSVIDGQPAWFDYRTKQSSTLSDALLSALELGVISEALIIDWRNEGSPKSFNQSLIDLFPIKNGRAIAFGGLSDPVQIHATLERPEITAVAIGNFLSYREHAVQEIKGSLSNLPLRRPVYQRTIKSCPEPQC